MKQRGQIPAAVLTIIGIVLIGALVWWAIANVGEKKDDGDGHLITEGEPLNLPDWETFSSPAHNFSIKHPEQVAVRETPDMVEFALRGPGDADGAEITDGFYLTVADENYAGHTSLGAYASAHYEEELQTNASVLAPEATTFNDRQAYVFVVRTQTDIQVEHVIIEHGVEQALHLMWYVQDPEEQGYAAILDIILKTLDFEDEGEGAPIFTKVSLALLDTSPEGDPDRGCDDVVFVERETLSPTTQPLNAALTQLFLLDDEDVDDNYNFIARTNDTLRFERASVEGDTAHIYLSGQLTGLAGVCDDPRAKIQIEETALNFSTVDNVRIYLNGVETDLQPSQQ